MADPVLEAVNCPLSKPLCGIIGDSLHAEFVLKNGTSPISLVGLSGLAEVVDSSDNSVILVLTVTVSQDLTSDPDPGRITVTATDAEMAGVSAHCIWYLYLTNGAGFTKTVLRGPCKFTARRG